MSCIGKILLLSFDGDEENLIESVISILDAGREKFIFQKMNLKSNLQHKEEMFIMDINFFLLKVQRDILWYVKTEIHIMMSKQDVRLI